MQIRYYRELAIGTALAVGSAQCIDAGALKIDMPRAAVALTASVTSTANTIVSVSIAAIPDPNLDAEWPRPEPEKPHATQKSA